MKSRVLLVAASVVALLVLGTATAWAQELTPGTQVEIVGQGYYNPDCYGERGQQMLREQPGTYWGVCQQPSAQRPSSGQGTVTKPFLSNWYQENNTTRVCTRRNGQRVCGWYPASSLKSNEATTKTAPASAAPRQQQQVNCNYTVRPGDTLGSIASRYGFTPEELWKNNAWIENPDVIVTGWTIDICRHKPR